MSHLPRSPPIGKYLTAGLVATGLVDQVRTAQICDEENLVVFKADGLFRTPEQVISLSAGGGCGHRPLPHSWHKLVAGAGVVIQSHGQHS